MRLPSAAAAAALLSSFLLLPAAEAGAESPHCQPASELRERLAAIDLLGSPSCRPGQACYEQRLAEARRLAETYPEELHAHRALQDLLRFNASFDRAAWEAAQEEYRQRAAAAPDDPATLYLHLRSDRSEGGAASWARLRDLDPEFPFAYSGLVQSAPQDERPDLLATFFRLCPSRPADVLRLRRAVPSPGFWRQQLPQLHRAVADAPPRQRVLAFGPLWSTEFSVVEAASHPQVRERLRAALSELEASELVRDELFWMAVTEGYRMLGDAAGLARAEAGLRASSPCSLDGAQAVIEQAQGGEVSLELPAERQAEMLRASEDWLERCPDQYLYSSVRFALVQKLAAGFSPDDLRREAERHLANWARNQHLVGTARSPWFQVAQLYLDRGLELERVPDLIEQEAAYVEGRRERQPIESAPESFRAQVQRGRLQQDLDLGLLRARAAIALGKVEPARHALARSELLLLELQEAAADQPFSTLGPEASLWRLKGELALLEERQLDALVYLQRALDTQPSDELERRVATLWRQLGGSEEARAVAGRVAAMAVEAEEHTGWTRHGEALEPFELSDLAGRTWRLEELAGRTVLINVWATWCGPCRAELPHFQEVRERFSKRPDIAVITLNVDHNIGLIQPYLERESFTFPVLLARTYVEELGDGGLVIPQNWIVDGDGTMRRKQLGFAPEVAAEWIEETVTEVEAVNSEAKEAGAEPDG